MCNLLDKISGPNGTYTLIVQVRATLLVLKLSPLFLGKNK
jgi:hypothetical protein